MNLRELTALRELLNPEDVFWVRSPDYQEQIFVSDSYVKVWERSTEELYKAPLSFNETLVPDEFVTQTMDRRVAGDIGTVDQSTFKINTASGVKCIVDKCFSLYHHNQLLGYAGIAREVNEQQFDQLNKAVSTVSSQTQNFISNFTKSLDYTVEQAESDFSRINQLLSERQKQCLYHLMRGQSAKSIAKALGLSPKTVEAHLACVREKLGCTSKADLIATLIDTGYFSN